MSGVVTAFSRPQTRLSWASPWPGELGAGAGAGRVGRAVGRGVALGVGVGVKTRGGEGDGGGLNVGCSSKSCICHIGRWNGGINCGRCCGLNPNNGNVEERSECDQESFTLVGGSAKQCVIRHNKKIMMKSLHLHGEARHKTLPFSMRSVNLGITPGVGKSTRYWMGPPLRRFALLVSSSSHSDRLPT